MDILEELTEDFVEKHTDSHLGTVVLKASQVRAMIRQNSTVRKLLHDIRPALRVLEASGSKDASHFVKRIDEIEGKL